MDPAWMVRSSERQALLESLQKMTEEYEEERGFRIDYDLSRMCLAFLEHSESPRIPRDASIDSWDFFQGKIVPACNAFARATEERDVLVCDFYQWLTESVTRDFRAALSRKEIADPQTMFHAASAAAEI